MGKIRNLVLAAALVAIGTVLTQAEERVISQDVAQGEAITSMQFELQTNGGAVQPMTNIVVSAGVTNVSFVWNFTPGAEYKVRTVAKNLAGSSTASPFTSAGSIPSTPSAPVITVP